MFGVLLSGAASFFAEVAAAVGKYEVREKKYGLFSMAFLSYFFAFWWFLGIVIYRGAFHFNPAAWPTFAARLVLEVILTYVSVRAIATASRSTFGFLRVGTMVLLLLVDVSLGYVVTLRQISGMAVIVLAFLILFLNHGLERKGFGWVILSTILPVATISLYKYNITYYNPVEVDQFLATAFLLLVFFFLAVWRERINPMRLLLSPASFGQSFGSGIGSALGSFAYIFAPASVIATIGRSSSMLWAMLVGNIYFREKHFLLKLVAAFMLVAGIFLMI